MSSLSNKTIRAAYDHDRQLWENCHLSTMDCFVWKFADGYVQMGDGVKVATTPNVQTVLALFDVFCRSSQKDEVTDNRLFQYYCHLRECISKEVQEDLKNREVLVQVPMAVSPWLWRTALGYFSHDESDDAAMKNLDGRYIDVLFPVNSRSFSRSTM
jgi:hypothetical protein